MIFMADCITNYVISPDHVIAVLKCGVGNHINVYRHMLLVHFLSAVTAKGQFLIDPTLFVGNCLKLAALSVVTYKPKLSKIKAIMQA